MKIAVIGIRGFPNVIGGPEAHAENLYPHLVAKGCEVIVFTRKPYVDPKVHNYKGIRLISLPCPRNKFLEAFSHTLFSVLVAKTINPDILHVHAIGPALYVPLARAMKMNIIMTHHGPDYERQKWGKIAKFVLKAGERFGAKLATNVICISEPIAENVKRKYGRDSVVIPNGVNIPAPIQGAGVLHKFGLKKATYVLAVGRFVPEKGFHDLIKAFQLFKKRTLGPKEVNCASSGFEWKLVIVGDATHQGTYSTQLKELAVKSPDTIMTGFLTGKPLEEIFCHAGLFVLPSYYEGLPIVLLEAMSHGISCLVSDIPSNRNVKLDEDRYFKPGDAEILSMKIKQFVNSPLSEKQRQEQFQMIRVHYDWKKIADKTLEVYRQSLNCKMVL